MKNTNIKETGFQTLQISHHTLEQHINETLRLLRKKFSTDHLILLVVLAEIYSR